MTRLNANSSPASPATWLAATRPAFLTVTVVAVALGWASALRDGVPFHGWAAAVTLVLALIVHAGANVINDVHDALNGCDAAESDRITPFTGGSRFIQDGVIGLRAMRALALALLLGVVPAGLALAWATGWGLLAIGAAGVGLAWAYSAPPLKLQSRGLGEVAITGAWWLVVAGADHVQRGAFSTTPVLIGLPYALLVAAVLYINQFPDVRADRVAGKFTAVVRWGPAAVWGYAALLFIAYGWLLALLLAQRVPAWGALALLPALVHGWAFVQLRRHASAPARLKPAIVATIAATQAHGALLAAALLLA